MFSIVVSGGLAAGALVLAAEPARAAAYTVDLVVAANCSATSSLNLPGVLNPGDVITINTSGPGVNAISTPCAVTVDGTSGNTTGWRDRTGGANIDMSAWTGVSMPLSTPQSLVFEVGSADATIFTELNMSFTPSPITMIATWAATGGGFTSSSTSSTSSSPGPAPVIQQFGKPTTGTCTDAASDELNWGGSFSGGWSESWAQWMNGGTGGSVCTRTLQYSGPRGAWVVG